jgi:HEPN domain-containing protein
MDNENITTEWLAFAQMDLDCAKHLFDTMHPQPSEIICYHSQQAAEKSLKAFLLFSGVNPPKTHDLNRLCEMCEDINEDFSEIALLCGSLTKYGIAPRYPYELEITDDDAKIALERAGMVSKFVLSKIPA